MIRRHPAGGPRIEPISVGEGEDLEYTAIFEVFPEISINGLDTISIERPVGAVTDEDIDAMYNSLFRELLTYMMEDPRNIGLCTHLLFGAKNIERIGDHATNIAETVYFLVHGKAITDQRPKSDTTSTTPLPLRPAV